MKIYEQEKSDGLVDQLKSRSVSYYTPLLSDENPPDNLSLHHISSLAKGAVEKTDGGHQDQDLFFCHSILVSTNWNKNDDVFTPAEVWPARHTPSHKPSNLNHNEKEIVGHLADCWAVDLAGDIISDDTAIDSLPDFFHIVNSSVIYKLWEDAGLTKRAVTLIAEIESGKKFVSMECLFKDFDYAIIEKGERKVVARNSETSFLTKYLRSYGGSGIYKDMRIGRLLKDIMFSGKGFVDSPANEHSIILNGVGDMISAAKNVITPNEVVKIVGLKEKTGFSDSGVCSLQRRLTKQLVASNDNNLQENIMPNELQDRIQSLEADLKAARDEAKSLRDDAVKAVADKLQAEISKLAQTINSMNESVTERDVSIAKLQKQVKENDISFKTMEKAKIEAVTKVAELTKANVVVERISILVDGGVSRDVAGKKVETLTALDEAAFTVIAKDIIDLYKPEKVEKKVEKTVKTEEVVKIEGDKSDTKGKTDDIEAKIEDQAEKVLDKSKASDDVIDSVPGDSEDELEKVTASVADYIGAHLELV